MQIIHRLFSASCQSGAALVLSKDPVLRYQVGTKKMKKPRYHVFVSTRGTEYPVDPVLAARSESCADALSS